QLDLPLGTGGIDQFQVREDIWSGGDLGGEELQCCRLIDWIQSDQRFSSVDLEQRETERTFPSGYIDPDEAARKTVITEQFIHRLQKAASRRKGSHHSFCLCPDQELPLVADQGQLDLNPFVGRVDQADQNPDRDIFKQVLRSDGPRKIETLEGRGCQGNAAVQSRLAADLEKAAQRGFSRLQFQPGAGRDLIGSEDFAAQACQLCSVLQSESSRIEGRFEGQSVWTVAFKDQFGIASGQITGGEAGVAF